MANLNGGRGWTSDACAASIHRLDAAYGRLLPITSAGRTYAEQAEAYRKYQNGGPLALPPGQSIHEQGNAVDWGSSAWGWLGLGAGVGWRGQTINRHGHRRTVPSETWHTEYALNEDNFRGQGGGGSNQDTINRQNWLNHARGEKLVVDGDAGPATIAAYKRYQEFLGVTADGDWGPATQAVHQKYYDEFMSGGNWPANKLYGEAHVKSVQDGLKRLNYYSGDIDGKDGPQTQDAVKRFQSDNGLTADGVGGPITLNKITDKLTPAPVGRNASERSTVDVQNRLIAKGYNLGQYGADGDYGAATTAAVIQFQKDNGLVPDGIYGVETDTKLFENAGPPNPVPDPTKYPTNGRNATTRPTADIQRLVGAEPDGSYGPNTSQKVAAWQDKNGLDADGIWGPASDLKGFPGVPLPDAPADPTADPLYGKKVPTYPGAIWADVSPNKSVRDKDSKIQLFVWHHIAAASSTNEGNRKRFMSPNDRNVSPNWYVQADGGVSEIVPPDDYRAWTGGAVDHQAVTVETQNTSGAPQWGISRESHEAIAQLVAWSAHRYEFPIQRGAVVLVNGKNVVTTPGLVGHSDTPAGKETGTLCPGPSADFEWVLNRAKAIYQEKYAVVEQPPVVTDPKVTLKEEIMDLLEQVARKIDAL